MTPIFDSSPFSLLHFRPRRLLIQKGAQPIERSVGYSATWIEKIDRPRPDTRCNCQWLLTRLPFRLDYYLFCFFVFDYDFHFFFQRPLFGRLFSSFDNRLYAFLFNCIRYFFLSIFFIFFWHCVREKVLLRFCRLLFDRGVFVRLDGEEVG